MVIESIKRVGVVTLISVTTRFFKGLGVILILIFVKVLSNIRKGLAKKLLKSWRNLKSWRDLGKRVGGLLLVLNSEGA